ncbi:hypothetical protein GCM10023116_36200 [Kistimonas scapharcae]|uniref:Uncharacterized protein n=2 Tax=Kistimonas scapharcae TaxID=1036133 RepID=A0ABP8V7P1_9GAMM
MEHESLEESGGRSASPVASVEVHEAQSIRSLSSAGGYELAEEALVELGDAAVSPQGSNLSLDTLTPDTVDTAEDAPAELPTTTTQSMMTPPAPTIVPMSNAGTPLIGSADQEVHSNHPIASTGLSDTREPCMPSLTHGVDEPALLLADDHLLTLNLDENRTGTGSGVRLDELDEISLTSAPSQTNLSTGSTRTAAGNEGQTWLEWIKNSVSGLWDAFVGLFRSLCNCCCCYTEQDDSDPHEQLSQLLSASRQHIDADSLRYFQRRREETTGGLSLWDESETAYSSLTDSFGSWQQAASENVGTSGANATGEAADLHTIDIDPGSIGDVERGSVMSLSRERQSEESPLDDQVLVARSREEGRSSPLLHPHAINAEQKAPSASSVSRVEEPLFHAVPQTSCETTPSLSPQGATAAPPVVPTTRALHPEIKQHETTVKNFTVALTSFFRYFLNNNYRNKIIRNHSSLKKELSKHHSKVLAYLECCEKHSFDRNQETVDIIVGSLKEAGLSEKQLFWLANGIDEFVFDEHDGRTSYLQAKILGFTKRIMDFPVTKRHLLTAINVYQQLILKDKR